jgi:HlyD family secretion protein
MIRDTSQQDRPIARIAGRRLRWRLLAAAAALLLLSGALALLAQRWWSGERSVDGSRVRFAAVKRGTLVRDVVADGRVTAANSPTLYAVAAGTIELMVVAGDKVAPGQPLAVLSSPELDSRLAQEQATLAALEAEIGRAELDVVKRQAASQRLFEQAEVDRQTASRELQRNQEAHRAGVLPEIDMLRSEDALKKADIGLAHAHKERALERRGLAFDLRPRRLAFERQREVVRELSRQVEALVIRSPVEGQVGQLMVAQRANVPVHAPVLSVVDLSAFELEIQVPDSFARDLAIGMPAEIRAGGAVYPGRVRAVSPEVVDGQVSSRLAFVGDKPAGLRQNQRLTARILLDEKPDALLVERGPFLETGGGLVAYVVQGDLAERRSIRTGAASLDAVEILSGLKAGDRIVISGADAFGDAERVRIAGD